MPRGIKGNAVSVADRTRKHRKASRNVEMLAAVAAARLIAGQNVGDAGRSLSKWLHKIAARKDIPDDYRDQIMEAAERLIRRSR